MDEVTQHRASEPEGVRRGVLAAVLLAVIGVAAVLMLAVLGARADTLEVVVEAGTWERIEAGEVVELLPRTLRVDVGDTLVVVNDDDHMHEVGPYTVGPGQTVRQTFTSPGTIEGVCTLHPDGEITIVVS